MRATVFAEAGCSEEFDKAWWQRKRKYEAGHPTDHGQLLRHRNSTEWCKIWVPDSVWKCLAIFLLSWLIWVIWAIAGSSWIEKKNASAPDSLNFGEISSVAWASEQTIPVDLQRIKVCWSDCYGCCGNECKEAANQQLVWQAFSASVINLFVFSRCACVWGVRYFQDGVQPKCVCVAFQSVLYLYSPSSHDPCLSFYNKRTVVALVCFGLCTSTEIQQSEVVKIGIVSGTSTWYDLICHKCCCLQRYRWDDVWNLPGASAGAERFEGPAREAGSGWQLTEMNTLY